MPIGVTLKEAKGRLIIYSVELFEIPDEFRYGFLSGLEGVISKVETHQALIAAGGYFSRTLPRDNWTVQVDYANGKTSLLRYSESDSVTPPINLPEPVRVSRYSREPVI